ncbi:MAG: hypothetical protein U5K27_01995 [Desulfotignum sp.]|nr:hypothetical protein [Desulfotignum sp.]
MLAHADMTEIFTIRRQLDIMTERLDREKGKLAGKTGALKEMAKARKARCRSPWGSWKPGNRELTAGCRRCVRSPPPGALGEMLKNSGLQNRSTP